MVFIKLDEDLPHIAGGKFPEALKAVAAHMHEHNILACSIACMGQLKKTDKYFVNLSVAKKTIPELADLRGFQHLIQIESRDYPHIIALKSDALKVEMN